MKPFLTRKKDGQVFPNRPRKVRRIQNQGVQRRLHAASGTSEYERLKATKDMFRRKLMLIAFLARNLREAGIRPIIVGGSAIEIYTTGQFESGDIDVVVNDRKKVIAFLESLGFRKKGKVLFSADLGIAMEVFERDYIGNEELVRTVRMYGQPVRVASIEDIIVGRLYSAKFWKGTPKLDLEQAHVLLRNYYDTIDFQYLESAAKKNDVEDLLANERKKLKL